MVTCEGNVQGAAERAMSKVIPCFRPRLELGRRLPVIPIHAHVFCTKGIQNDPEQIG